jgi:simple sugar transport system permease protein
VLKSIPWLGEVLFQQDVMVYAAIVATVLIWLLMSRTWFGVYVRAAGERPSAVLATGRDVQWVRFNAMLIACGFAGIAGAALIVAVAGAFNVNITAGQGFIALAVVVVARWNPLFTALVALGFGVSQGLQFQVNDLGFLSGLPTEFWIALPYMVVILALARSRGSQYPPALGIPYVKPGAVSLWQRIQGLLPGRSDSGTPTEAPPPGQATGRDVSEMRGTGEDSRSPADRREPR